MVRRRSGPNSSVALSMPTAERNRGLMQFRRSDFADLSYFLEIARHRNFRRAGLELGHPAHGRGAPRAMSALANLPARQGAQRARGRNVASSFIVSRHPAEPAAIDMAVGD